MSATALPSVGALAGEVGLSGISPDLPRHHLRFLRQLTDEISEIVAHGGRGSLSALLDHLQVRFGAVTPDDLAHALALAPGNVREVFRDDR